VTKVGFGGSYEFAAKLALQPDGKIVVAGWGKDAGAHDFSVARLQGDPGGAAVGPRRCAGKQATIIGTNAKDKLKGTKKKDVIAALGGKDLVKGKSGNDLICGGKGNDKLLGGKGKDKLLGGPGKDKLLGGPGKDKLLGGPGKDTLKGGPGKDSVKLRRNTSVLSGPAARGGA
jgi:Ca2+-binding RTX toxin-like protein